MNIVFACPYLGEMPMAPFRKSLEDCLPLLEANGFEHRIICEENNPYISNARSVMTRKALDWLKEPTGAIIYLDYDVSWRPEDMLKLLKTEGEVVAGSYRFKLEKEDYMGKWHIAADGRPVLRKSDGAIKAASAPAGFLKVSVLALIKFMRAHPKLVFGLPYYPYVDLFNHGAHEGVWWGEDYAFCRIYEAAGGDIWVVPDLNISHWGRDGKEYPGNLHRWLLAQPGGSNHKPETTEPAAATLALPSDPQPTRSDNGIPDAA